MRNAVDARLRAAVLQLPRHDAADRAARSTTRPTAAAPGWCCGSTSSTRRCGRAYGERRARRVIVLLTPSGAPLDDALATELAAEPHLALLCGRYEGVDERVREHLADDAVSIGPYVLSGGELAAMVVADAVLRKLPGALGHADSAVEESFSEALGGAPEYPHYTRPAQLSRLGGAGGPALRRPRAGPRVAARAAAASALRSRTTSAASCLLSDARGRAEFRPLQGPRLIPRSFTMSTIIESIEQRQLQKVPRFERRRPRPRALPGDRGHPQPNPGLRGHRDRPPGLRRARDVHRPQAVVRRRRRAHLPGPLAEDRAARGRRPRRRAPGEALLPARPGRQARPGRRAPLGDRGRPRDGRGRGGRRRSTPRESARRRPRRGRARGRGGRARPSERRRGSAEQAPRAQPPGRRRGRSAG